MRRWRVEVECGGAPFVWTGPAVNEQAAIRCAAYDLEVKRPNVAAHQITATVVIDQGEWTPPDEKHDWPACGTFRGGRCTCDEHGWRTAAFAAALAFRDGMPEVAR